MPVYDYKCPLCLKRREVFRKLAELDDPVACFCGQPMLRQISAPYVRGDYPPYECPVTGKMIEGRRAHEENLKRTGCRIYEPGEKHDFERRQRAEDAAFDAKIEETADRFVAGLPTEKRDRLAAEMEGGLTTQIERSTPTL